jgi:hypothetical protein
MSIGNKTSHLQTSLVGIQWRCVVICEGRMESKLSNTGLAIEHFEDEHLAALYLTQLVPTVSISFTP